MHRSRRFGRYLALRLGISLPLQPGDIPDVPASDRPSESGPKGPATSGVQLLNPSYQSKIGRSLV